MHHGEGLKAAASTLLREGCQFEIHHCNLTLRFFLENGEEVSITSKRGFGSKHVSQLPIENGKALLTVLERSFKVKRDKDVIQIVQGLQQFDSLKYFLSHTHKEVSSLSELDQWGSCFRLKTPHGDILWQSKAFCGTEKDLSGCVYVGGVLWEHRSDLKRYGVDLHKNASQSRDKAHVEESTYCWLLARIVDSLLTQGQHEFFDEAILEDLEQAVKVGDVPHLKKLPDEISEEACQRLALTFKRKHHLENGVVYLGNKQDPINSRTLKQMVDKRLCLFTSEFLYKVLTKHHDISDLTEIKESSLKKIRSYPTTTSWQENVKKGISGTFGDEIWKHLVLHATEDILEVPVCMYDPLACKIRLSSSRVNSKFPVHKLIHLLGKEMKKLPPLPQPDAPRTTQDQSPVRKSDTSVDPNPPSPSTAAPLSDTSGEGTPSLNFDLWDEMSWRTLLEGNMSNICNDALRTPNERSASPALSKTLLVGNTCIWCTQSGVEKLASFQKYLAQDVNTISAASEQIVALIRWKRAAAPIFIFTEEPIIGFSSHDNIYVNLRPLLMEETPCSQERAFVYLAVVLTHEVVHLVHRGSISSQARLMDRLMARVMLKTTHMLIQQQSHFGNAPSSSSSSSIPNSAEEEAASATRPKKRARTTKPRTSKNITVKTESTAEDEEETVIAKKSKPN